MVDNMEDIKVDSREYSWIVVASLESFDKCSRHNLYTWSQELMRMNNGSAFG